MNMTISDALWEVFKATGHIGAYLLYKDYRFNEEGNDNPGHCSCYLDDVQAE